MNIEQLPLTMKRIEQRKAEKMRKQLEQNARRARWAEIESEAARAALLTMAAECRQNRFSASQSDENAEGEGQGTHIPRIALGD